MADLQIVKARAVKQTHPGTGEINLTLTTDPMTPLKEFAIGSEGWCDGELAEGEMLIVGSREMLADVMDTEFRSAGK